MLIDAALFQLISPAVGYYVSIAPLEFKGRTFCSFLLSSSFTFSLYEGVSDWVVHDRCSALFLLQVCRLCFPLVRNLSLTVPGEVHAEDDLHQDEDDGCQHGRHDYRNGRRLHCGRGAGGARATQGGTRRARIGKSGKGCGRGCGCSLGSRAIYTYRQTSVTKIKRNYNHIYSDHFMSEGIPSLQRESRRSLRGVLWSWLGVV